VSNKRQISCLAWTQLFKLKSNVLATLATIILHFRH